MTTVTIRSLTKTMDTSQKRSPSASTIEKLVESGKTLAAIGKDYGVSRQRIHQILNANGQSVGAISPHKGHGVNCPHCGNDRLHAHTKTSAGRPRLYCLDCRKAFTVGVTEGRSTWQQKDDRKTANSF